MLKSYWKALLLVITLIFSCLSFAGVSEWVDFELKNGHIKIPVKLSGIDTYALLDTGAQGNSINPNFVRKHGLQFTKGQRFRVTGVFGEEMRRAYNNVPTTIFGADLELDDLIPVNLGGTETGLLIGSGFFSRFIVQFDYPNQRMRIVTRDVLRLGDIENIKVESQRGSGEPLVRVSFGEDSDPFWVLLDTGSNGGLLIERSLARKHNLLEKITSSSMSSGVNSTAITENLRVEELIFGPFTLENVLVSVPAEGESANLVDQNRLTGSRIKSRKQEGILGYDVLKHFVLTLDYRAGHAHISLPE
ncbi:pepsin/retropepsin-like aspartic protease family protein [Planctobacterium marinum]|uniref:Signal protein PDZ n=1 Tax=Planctobacterium marinum TaxID=1631968 RepID=A0AA48KQE8_9ALTE|nr:hypothetical protein MACH26_19440 [Planctobacterium marinum]